MSKTKIEWADAVWNPTLGCAKIATGCKNCYAIPETWRKTKHPDLKIHHAYNRNMLVIVQPNGRPEWTGTITTLPERLEIPLHVRKPTTWFVNSMSDLFYPTIPQDFVDAVHAVMRHCHWHRFIVLTKRFDRCAEYLEGLSAGRIEELHQKAASTFQWYAPESSSWPPHNIIYGFSVSTDYDLGLARKAIERMYKCGMAPALSCEPLVGPVNIMPVVSRLSWVIVGGESGKDARPMHPEWPISILAACNAKNIPIFFKQWGQFAPCDPGAPHAIMVRSQWNAPDCAMQYHRRKRSAGMKLLGKTWHQHPWDRFKVETSVPPQQPEPDPREGKSSPIECGCVLDQ